MVHMLRHMFLMKKLIICLSFFITMAQADVIVLEDNVIHYSVPEGLLKKPSAKDDILAYFDDKKDIKLIIQTFRKQQWADWHMRGLIKSKKTFQKYFDTELGGSNGEKLDKLHYDDKKYELTLWWTQADGEMLLSRMKLTSFGCIAIHVPVTPAELEHAEIVLNNVSESVLIPDNLKFKPKSMISDIMSNIGGGFIFIVISLSYLLFSLLKRSQLHQVKLERRMKQAKPAQLQSRAY